MTLLVHQNILIFWIILACVSSSSNWIDVHLLLSSIIVTFGLQVHLFRCAHTQNNNSRMRGSKTTEKNNGEKQNRNTDGTATATPIYQLRRSIYGNGTISHSNISKTYMPNGMISKQKWCVYFHRKKDGPRDRERARGSTTKKTPRNLDVQMCMWCVDSIYSIPVHSVSHTRSFARSLVHSFARFQLYQNHQNVRISAYLRIQLIWNLNYLHLTLLSLPLPPSAASTIFTSPQVAQIYSAFLGGLFCFVLFGVFLRASDI